MTSLRYAVRALRLRPGFTAMVAVTLSLGIGANAAMFGILDRLLFRAPAHVSDPDRVVQVHTRRLGDTSVQTSQSYRLHRDLLENVPEFASVAVSTRADEKYLPLGRGATATRVRGAQVTPSFFPTLGVRPLLGRFFQEDEAGEVNPQKLAVLGHGFWQRHFAGGQDALGSVLQLGNDEYTVVGIAPKGFTGAELADVDVWIPIAAADGFRLLKGPEWRTTRGSTWLYIYARLRPDASMNQALARSNAALRAGIVEEYATRPTRPNPDSTEILLGSLIPGRSPQTFGAVSASSGEFRVSRLLGAVSLLVLLLACANVANLLLVRAIGRRREIAVRIALGIGRRRLAGELLLEGVLLAALGGAGALVVVFFGSGFVRGVLLGSAAWSGSAIDLRVLGFTAVVALLTGLVTSLVPALQASHPDITTSLKAGVREGGGTKSFTRSFLLGTQAALAVVLLVGAGLFVKSLRRVAELPLGVDIDRVLIADVEHTSVGLDNEQARDLYFRFAERVREVPGVTASAVSIAHSFGLGWGASVYAGGRRVVEPGSGPGFSQYAITPDYFQVMGVRLLSGRGFDERDREGAPLTAIINETAARKYWPAGNAIGECIKVGADSMPCTTIVGIASNARRQSLVEEPIPQLYRPLVQIPLSVTNNTVSAFGYTLLARTERDPAGLVEPIRRAMQGTAAIVPYANVRPLRDPFGRHTRTWTMGATMFSVFGGLALTLALVGLYSVVVFSMTQRMHEYGVRLALGATGGHLVLLTMMRGMVPAALGVLAGLTIALLGANAVGALLFETSARDPWVLGSVAVLLLGAAGVASLMPGLSAARTDPRVVLQSE
jgi:predicted permease